MNFVLHQDMKNTHTLIFNHLWKFFTVEGWDERQYSDCIVTGKSLSGN